MVILDSKNTLDSLNEQFWARLTEEKQLFLLKDVAPLMRTRTGEDYKAMSFELKVIQYSIARLSKNEAQNKKVITLEEVLIEMVSDLPLSVNVVAREKDLVEAVLHGGYLSIAKEKDFDILIEKIAPLMKDREEGIKPKQDAFDLRDITSEKEYIEFGAANERITIKKYREKVEALVKKLEELEELKKAVEKEISSPEATPPKKEVLEKIIEEKYFPKKTEIENLKPALTEIEKVKEQYKLSLIHI